MSSIHVFFPVPLFAGFSKHVLTNSSCVSFQGKEFLPRTGIPDLNIAFVSPHCHQVTLEKKRFKKEN